MKKIISTIPVIRAKTARRIQSENSKRFRAVSKYSDSGKMSAKALIYVPPEPVKERGIFADLTEKSQSARLPWQRRKVIKLSMQEQMDLYRQRKSV